MPRDAVAHQIQVSGIGNPDIILSVDLPDTATDIPDILDTDFAFQLFRQKQEPVVRRIAALEPGRQKLHGLFPECQLVTLQAVTLGLSDLQDKAVAEIFLQPSKSPGQRGLGSQIHLGQLLGCHIALLHKQVKEEACEPLFFLIVHEAVFPSAVPLYQQCRAFRLLGCRDEIALLRQVSDLNSVFLADAFQILYVIADGPLAFLQLFF